MKSLLAAVAFLTRLPVSGRWNFDAGDVARSAGWFPLVGLVLGCLYSLAATLLRSAIPLAVVAVLLVVLEALATGALHFDGLADTADGFGGGRDREDVLRIMRDHAIGAYGALALVICVTLKLAAYTALLTQTDWIPALILAPALGRWSILLLTAFLRYARPTESPAAAMGKRPLAWGTAAIVIALAGARSSRAVAAAVACLALTACFGIYCRRRIGGITGDTLGANVQLCESVALITFLWGRAPR